MYKMLMLNCIFTSQYRSNRDGNKVSQIYFVIIKLI